MTEIVKLLRAARVVEARIQEYTNYYLYYWNAPGGPYSIQDPDTVLEDNTGYWVWIDQNMTVTVP